MEKYLTELSEQELTAKLKEMKKNMMIDATLIGFTFGISIYSAVKNVFGFFTFFPLILTYLIVRNSKNTKLLQSEIEKELESRISKHP